MPDGGYNIVRGGVSRQEQDLAFAKAVAGVDAQLGHNHAFRDFFMAMHLPEEAQPPALRDFIQKTHGHIAGLNAVSKAFRDNTRKSRQFAKLTELRQRGDISESDYQKAQQALSKAVLDVGTLTNFASITGGQSLGYVSLDVQMARGTVRPNSFTIYQCLRKSGAFQVVDYWPYASDTGGGMPGTAFQAFGNVSSGTLATSAGVYDLYNITLKLATNGRAITMALAAQNSFVDVTAQENINAALTVLESANWATYWGNPTFYPNQFTGIYNALYAQNIFDWYQFQKAQSSQGWSNAQAMFNLIYEAAALITGYKQFGRVTHAFMSPVAAGALQGLVTTVLNNIITVITPSQERLTGIVVDGDLQGMRTRFGEIQFPIDLYITARDKPASAIFIDGTTTSYATLTISPPSGVTAAVVTGSVSGSAWDATFVASSGIYSYAVASMDASMNESNLTILTGNSISGIAASGAYAITIAPPATVPQAFRVYRSGLGYSPASSGAANPASYRYIGTILASGSSNVIFTDLNTWIPGSDTVFLLDLDDNDAAIDFRYLLPLTKIDLFAQNLFMPWAVAMIGAVRLKIPKFHGAIKNFISDNPDFNPLAPNPAAT